MAMFRKLVILLLTLGALGTSTLWIMSHFDRLCGWTHDGTVGRYQYRVGHSDCRPTWRGSPPYWFLLAHDPSDSRSTKYSKLSQGLASLEWYHRISPSPGSAPPANRLIRLGDFGFERTRSSECTGRWTTPNVCETGVHVKVQVPLWALVATFSCYPAIVFLRGPLRRWRRQRRGMCAACGYDLTGNVSGVCPECGATV
jgi:hypothetical protein